MVKDTFPQLAIVEIPLLTVDKLLLPETKKRIRNSTKQALMDNDNEMARKLGNKIKDLFNNDKENKINASVRNEYLNLVTLLFFPQLTFLGNREIEDLFSNYLVELLKRDTDILWPVENYIDYYGDTKKTHDFLNLATRSMGQNNEKIGKTKINLETQEKSVEPTIANWLRHYNSFFADSKKTATLEEADFFQNDKHVKKLSSDDTKLLKQIIRLYNFLKSPGQFAKSSVQPIKEIPSKKIGLPKESGFLPSDNLALEEKQDVLKPEKKQQTPEEAEIIKAYQGDPKQVKMIQKEQDKVIKKIGEDPVDLREEFFRAVQKRNVNRTIAILRILAAKKDLENFLKEDKKLNKFLTTIWEKQYGEKFVDEFNKKPDQLKFVRQFLQYVLEQRLGMETSDAARIGLQIGNIFVSLGKRSYNKMAYFDVKNKVFKWFE